MRIVSPELPTGHCYPFFDDMGGTDPKRQQELMQQHAELLPRLRREGVASVHAIYSCFLMIQVDGLRILDAQGREMCRHSDQLTETTDDLKIGISDDSHADITDFLVSLCVLVFPDWPDVGCKGQLQWDLDPDVMQMSYQEGIQTAQLQSLAPSSPAATSSGTPRASVKPTCEKCGSENVSADAAVRWSVDVQEWEVTNAFDKGTRCDDCESMDIELIWVEAQGPSAMR